VADPAAALRRASRRLQRELSDLRFAAPVTHVYNPLEYAREPHEAYLARARAGVRVVYLGMNPGPFGMAQTGVPFGEVALVRDWLRISGKVGRPTDEHPKRPIQGFDCTRSEVSGARLWGAAKEHFGTPGRFFRHGFISNYCPLLFMEESGRNRTPDKLPAEEREPLFAACDRHLAAVVRALEPRWLIGIGAFAARRAREVLGEGGPEIGGVLHPSPASPLANRGWAEQALAQLREQGVCREKGA